MIIEPRTLPLNEMPWHVCLIYAVWILGMMCAKSELPAHHWHDMSEDERIEEWLSDV